MEVKALQKFKFMLEGKTYEYAVGDVFDYKDEVEAQRMIDAGVLAPTHGQMELPLNPTPANPSEDERLAAEAQAQADQDAANEQAKKDQEAADAQAKADAEKAEAEVTDENKKAAESAGTNGEASGDGETKKPEEAGDDEDDDDDDSDLIGK